MRRWGVFLIIASQNPYAHKSLIWFTVWSSVVHGAIMGVQSFNDPAERGHLIGDVPALFLVAIVLAVLMSRTEQALAARVGWQLSVRHLLSSLTVAGQTSSEPNRSQKQRKRNDRSLLVTADNPVWLCEGALEKLRGHMFGD